MLEDGYAPFKQARIKISYFGYVKYGTKYGNSIALKYDVTSFKATEIQMARKKKYIEFALNVILYVIQVKPELENVSFVINKVNLSRFQLSR